MFSNIAWTTAWTLAGRGDEERRSKLGAPERESLKSLAELALARDPESRAWRKDVLAVVVTA